MWGNSSIHDTLEVFIPKALRCLQFELKYRCNGKECVSNNQTNGEIIEGTRSWNAAALLVQAEWSNRSTTQALIERLVIVPWDLRLIVQKAQHYQLHPNSVKSSSCPRCKSSRNMQLVSLHLTAPPPVLLI